MEILKPTFWIDAFSSKIVEKKAEGPRSNLGLKMLILLNQQISLVVVWSLINFMIGGIGLYCLKGQWYFFSMMNLSWGIVNLMIGLGLFYHIGEKRFCSGSFREQLVIQHHVEKMLLLNIGLDLFYQAVGGIFLVYGWVELSLDTALFVGFGISIIGQGFYLWVQDLVFFRFHYLNRKRFTLLERQITKSFSGSGK